MAQNKNVPVAEALIKAGAIVNALDKVNSLCCSFFDSLCLVLIRHHLHTYVCCYVCKMIPVLNCVRPLKPSNSLQR